MTRQDVSDVISSVVAVCLCFAIGSIAAINDNGLV